MATLLLNYNVSFTGVIQVWLLSIKYIHLLIKIQLNGFLRIIHIDPNEEVSLVSDMVDDSMYFATQVIPHYPWGNPSMKPRRGKFL